MGIVMFWISLQNYTTKLASTLVQLEIITKQVKQLQTIVLKQQKTGNLKCLAAHT